MAWSTPVTAIAGAALTAAQWNASVRDNLLETAPAKASAGGRIIVTTGVNGIAERAILDDIVNTTGTRTSSTYGTLTSGGTGPTVTVTTGPQALVFMAARMENDTAGVACWASFAISGATTDAAIDQRALLAQAGAGDANRFGATSLNAVTPGSNTFQMQYKVTSGTGEFQDRREVVMAL